MMKCSISFLQVAAAMLQLNSVICDGQYKSRPDLSPPKLNITIPATADVADGYIFSAPYSSSATGSPGPLQPGAYIFRNDGDLVWSGLTYYSGFVANFHVTEWHGQSVLQAFQGQLDLEHGHAYGHVGILNQHYEGIREVRSRSPVIMSLHEFNVIQETTALVEIFQQTPANLTLYGGDEEQTWIADGIAQELNVETGELIWEWKSLDHVDPSLSALPLKEGAAGTGRNSTDAWDYFHINSVDKDDLGNYLISGRHASTVYKIDGLTGEIIWQLGGKNSTFTYDNELLTFGFQHDARFRGRTGNLEVISLFDNAAKAARGHEGVGDYKVHDYSSGKYIQLNHSDGTATLVKHLIHPDRVLAASQGNVQLLPNGNSFINWGQAGQVTEYRANDSKPIFNAVLDSGVNGKWTQSYRGFRSEWTGKPHEPPAVVVYHENESCSNASVYVSWNGDTKTSLWRFYALPDLKSGDNFKRFLGQRDRTSFETHFEFSPGVHGFSSSVTVVAEAVDAQGHVLASASSRKRL